MINYITPIGVLIPFLLPHFRGLEQEIKKPKVKIRQTSFTVVFIFNDDLF